MSNSSKNLFYSLFQKQIAWFITNIWKNFLENTKARRRKFTGSRKTIMSPGTNPFWSTQLLGFRNGSTIISTLWPPNCIVRSFAKNLKKVRSSSNHYKTSRFSLNYTEKVSKKTSFKTYCPKIKLSMILYFKFRKRCQSHLSNQIFLASRVCCSPTVSCLTKRKSSGTHVAMNRLSKK